MSRGTPGSYRDAHHTAKDDIPKPAVTIRFAGIKVPIRCSVMGQANVGDLQRQAWERVQSAHHRLLNWCRVAVRYELRPLDWKPSSELPFHRLESS